MEATGKLFLVISFIFWAGGGAVALMLGVTSIILGGRGEKICDLAFGAWLRFCLPIGFLLIIPAAVLIEISR